jgi:hypothetical protein
MSSTTCRAPASRTRARARRWSARAGRCTRGGRGGTLAAPPACASKSPTATTAMRRGWYLRGAARELRALGDSALPGGSMNCDAARRRLVGSPRAPPGAWGAPAAVEGPHGCRGDALDDFDLRRGAGAWRSRGAAAGRRAGAGGGGGGAHLANGEAFCVQRPTHERCDVVLVGAPVRRAPLAPLLHDDPPLRLDVRVRAANKPGQHPGAGSASAPSAPAWRAERPPARPLPGRARHGGGRGRGGAPTCPTRAAR